ncbi:MAG: hypothetical protein E7527_07310 [Ruminococcaceae bacterium]|nr:hypothetical protein [Oscillospiraceae bacterium]
MRRIFACTLVLIVALLAVGCQTPSEPLDITGTWVATNGEEIISYQFSGSDSVSVDYPGGYMNCSYRIDENDRIVVYTHVPMGGESTIATFRHYTMDGGTEILESIDDGLKFIRQKEDN